MFSIVRRVASQPRARMMSSLGKLQATMEEVIPAECAKHKAFVQKHGNASLGEVTVSQAYGGMRGIKSLVSDISHLDAEEGIRFRGLSIPECREQLPAADVEPLPESLMWLLMTGRVPTAAETKDLSDVMAAHQGLPQHVVDLLASFPKDLHPMSQLVSAVAALQSESKFARAYADGVHKSKYWGPTLEDSVSLIAKLPELAARIYRRAFKDSNEPAAKYDASMDWGWNFARMLGYTDKQFAELMRLYLVIHADHEAGNVSAHATHLVGSALSDPYLSYAAGMAGLAGPLHGLANQEVLRWTQNMQAKLGAGPYTNEQITAALWDTLNSGNVVPGFGHAVLRKTDPRYMCQREFAQKHLPEDPLFQLVSQIYECAPKVLTEHGKTKNPWPNVDAHSGVLLTHYGMVEQDYYTVLFGVSRAIGVLSNLVWHRAMGSPIERPKSMDLNWLQTNFKE